MPLDAADLDACYRRIEHPLYNVLYRWLWEPQACQDVMHDAFLRLWSERARLVPTQLDALAYATALNLARNRLRWQRLRVWVGIESLQASATGDSDGPESAAEQQRLRRALAQLPEADRTLLLLAEFSGFDTAELASLLGVAPGTVGSRRHRALTRLRQLMGAGNERTGG